MFENVAVFAISNQSLQKVLTWQENLFAKEQGKESENAEFYADLICW
jgi:hypothetical protein